MKRSTFPSRHITIQINQEPKSVYEFVSNPANLPLWAAGLSGSIQKVGDDWIAESPRGPVKVKFADKNDFGVLDHLVTLPTGETINNPLRVVPNGSGCELIFNLFQRDNITIEHFEEDAKFIESDLKRLKEILEK